MTTAEIMARVLTRIPQVFEVVDNDASECQCYRFTWRSTRFQVSSTLSVDEVVGGTLARTDAAVLLHTLLMYPEDPSR